MNKSIIIPITISIAMLLLPTLLLAQAYTDDVSDAPIDGGLSLLVAAGVGYGVKKVKERRKK